MSWQPRRQRQALTDHIDDAADAHDATAISYAGSTNVAATTVEGAIDELDTEKHRRFGLNRTDEPDNHTGDTSDAHDASAISVARCGRRLHGD